MTQTTKSIRIYPDVLSLAQAVADHIVDHASSAIAEQGFFSIALSGGSTPKSGYELLTNNAPSMGWENTHIFWSDERCVPPDHPDSNYQMARKAFIDRVSIPRQNIHRIRGEDLPEQATSNYEQVLRTFFSQHTPRTTNRISTFDLVILGLGEDGHIASLFPDSDALNITDRWVVTVQHDKPPLPLIQRISLTLPVINAAKQITFIVSGSNKAHILQRVHSAPTPGVPLLPAQLIHPYEDKIIWLVDSDARKSEL